MVSPRLLAMLYDLYLAAVWRGQEPPGEFGAWLEARWWAGGKAEPDVPPDAVSVLGGAGAGIRWYEVGETIIGYVGGRPRGCYVVSRDDVPPQLPAVSIEPRAEPVQPPVPTP